MEDWTIDILDTQYRGYRYSIDTSFHTWSTFVRQSVERRLIFDWFIWVSQHSASYRPTALIKCQSSIDWDVDPGYQSRVLIDIWPWMLLVHMAAVCWEGECDELKECPVYEASLNVFLMFVNRWTSILPSPVTQCYRSKMWWCKTNFLFSAIYLYAGNQVLE